IANFTFSATDKTVNLNATSSYDPDGIITQYNWATSNGLAAAGQIASLNFPNYGRYDVNLSVMDDYGSVSTKFQSINLQQIVTNYTINGITDGKGSLTINADNCGNNCSRQYPENSQISITAIPNNGYVLEKWAGACSGNTSTCIITVNNDTTVQAFFKQQITNESFNVGIQTGGNGFITTKDQTCTQSNCSLNLTVQQGELVRFVATPNAGYQFDSWSGVCIGSTDPTCEVTLTGNISIQANFKQQAPDNVVLTTTTNGNGNVTASGSNCGTGCSFTPNTTVSLVATPQTGYEFTGWNGCVSSSETCSLEMTTNTVVTANFAEKSISTDTYSLSVNLVDSSGTPLTNTDLSASVIGENINCGTDSSICQASFAEDKTVNLIISLSAGTEFVEWTGGGCSGNNTKCTVQVTQDRQVTAIFQKTSVLTNALNITIKGSGLVNVKGDDLEATCNATSCEPIIFERNSSNRMTLVANPLLGFKFTGWDGACSGAEDCSLAMGKDHAVRAVFEPMQGGFELSVVREGTGSGKVSGDGIACGFGDDICDSNYPEGLTVTLNVETDVNSLFIGWQGACASFKDEPECIVTMNSDMRVSAEFELDNSSLGKRIILTKHAIDNSGNPVEDVAGSGYVFDTKLNTNLKGVNCATNCKSHKGVYDGLNTTTVTLQVKPYVGSQFSHWSGGTCSGQKSLCQVTLASEERNVEVTANFVQTSPPLKTVIIGSTEETQGEWAGGIAKIDSVNTPVTYGAYLKKQTIVASDEADIRIEFKPDPAHYAQEVDIVVILGYAVPESIFPAEYYTMGELLGVLRWSGSPNDILAFRKDVFLTDTVEKIQLYSGHLPIGNVWLYAGYRLDTGQIIFNEEAVNVRVNP
ncbi:MAG: PKD domain-containing protein, partial [Thiotrichaceae bacterium]|nr:PKD domain-containing protein [Thiotrichaceae bacterium]